MRDQAKSKSDLEKRPVELVGRGIAEQIGKTLESDPTGITTSMREQYEHSTDGTGSKAVLDVMRSLLDPPTNSTMQSVKNTMVALGQGMMDQDQRPGEMPKQYNNRMETKADNFGFLMGSMNHALKDAAISANQRVDLAVGLSKGISEIVPGGNYLAGAAETIGDWAKHGNEMDKQDIMRSFLSLANPLNDAAGQSMQRKWETYFNDVSPEKLRLDHYRGEEVERGSLAEALAKKAKEMGKEAGGNYLAEQAKARLSE
jgi:hypothetical protein